MNYMRILDCDIANGPGWRISLFVSGCTIHCKGCFNQHTWDFCSGKPFTKETENKILELLNRPYIRGLSILGGNPTEPQNEEELVKLCKRVKEELPNKDIWVWSGSTYEELLARGSKLLDVCDVLVDGPFIEEFRDVTLKFRGSSNQKLIDLKKSKKCGKIVRIE